MAEYVDRERLKEAFITDLQTLQTVDEHTLNLVILEIEEAPTADVAPVVHGRWEKCGNTKHKMYCKNCGGERLFKKIKNGYFLVVDSAYCPHCGAKMDGGKSNGKT